MDVRRRIGHFSPAGLPGLLDLRQDLQEARPPVTVIRREVSSPEERFQLRREEHVQGPATLAASGLDKGHVDLVHVRPLLAVHLDADEVGVQEAGDLGALEGFAFHDVAPMAGRVTDAQEDRPVLLARAGERFLAPGIPVHRVILVLEQIGRFLARQAVRRSRRARAGWLRQNSLHFRCGRLLPATGRSIGASVRQGSGHVPVQSGNHSLQPRRTQKGRMKSPQLQRATASGGRSNALRSGLRCPGVLASTRSDRRGWAHLMDALPPSPLPCAQSAWEGEWLFGPPTPGGGRWGGLTRGYFLLAPPGLQSAALRAERRRLWQWQELRPERLSPANRTRLRRWLTSN